MKLFEVGKQIEDMCVVCSVNICVLSKDGCSYCFRTSNICEALPSL